MYETKNPTRLGRQVIADLEQSLTSSRRSGRVQVFGHRGAPAPGRPENSVAAVTRALRQGADGVEVDIWLTADDALVCTHDALVRTRAGAKAAAAACTRGDLVGEDGRPLATLDELLAAVQGPVARRVVVEAKPVADPALALRTAQVLADVLRTGTGTAHVTVSSFDPALLAVIRRTCADLPVRTALLGDSADAAATVVRRAAADGHDEVHLPLAAVRRTPRALDLARWSGLSVSLWTVNDRRDLRWAAELGVDAVITDDVPAARGQLDAIAIARPAGTVAVTAA